MSEVVPLGEVANGKWFAVKVAGTICALNMLGVLLYWRGAQRAASLAVTPE